MGNGGCNCNVQNIDMVLPTRIKIINNNKYVGKQLNNLIFIDNNAIFDIDNFNNINSSINLEFCKKNSIGPFFLKNIKLEINFKNKSEIVKKEVDKLLEQNTETSRNDSNNEKLNLNKISKNNTMLKLIKKLQNLDLEKISLFFHFIFDNSIRVLFYNIYLPLEIQKIKYQNKNNNLFLKENLLKGISTYNSEVIFQIERDIQRTFPENKIFEEQIFYDNLKESLIEVSIQDEEVSYVQGMNFILAYILMMTGNHKELSINFFMRILNLKSELFNMPFREILTDKFKLLFLYINKFNQIFSKHNSKIFNIFHKLEISDFLWISKWWQTLFSYKFKFELVSKFLDIVIINGIDYILLITLAIVEYFGNRFKLINSIEEFLDICEDIYNIRQYEFSNLLNFILIKIKSKEYKEYITN